MMLAYYIGAYGPTIRLDTQALEDLRAVRRFEALCNYKIVKEDD